MPWFFKKKKPQNSLSPKRRELVEYSRKRQLYDRVRSKLSNLAFMLSNPRKTLEIRRSIGPYYVRRAKLTAIKHELSRMLAEQGLKPARIFSRVKTTKSLASKIDIQKRPANRVFREAIGLRIIARNSLDCGKISASIKSMMKPENLLRFENYIKYPRAYGYQGIHLVTDYFGYPVEIQIRSLEMEKKVRELDDAMGRFENSPEKARRKEFDKIAEKTEQAVKEARQKLNPKTFRHNLIFVFENSELPFDIAMNVARKLLAENAIDKRAFEDLRKKLKKKTQEPE